MMNTRKHWQRLTLVIAVVCGMIMFAAVSPSVATGPIWSYSYEQLAAEWWKWVSSIPCSSDETGPYPPGWPNPVYDETGENCAVGQHGDVWFLAGTFGGAVTRNCYVPEGKMLFFPVFNASWFDSPNACGQGPAPWGVGYMRAQLRAWVDGATDLRATLDGKPLRMQREQSVVFEISVPKDNLYKYWGWDVPESPCPQGVYSPTVDDGYYVLLNPLKKGSHTITIHAGTFLDVTYNLTVVPVKLK